MWLEFFIDITSKTHINTKNRKSQKIHQKTSIVSNTRQNKQKIPKKENCDLQIQRQSIQSQNKF